MKNNCILNPSFKIKVGKAEEIKLLLVEILAKTQKEEGCLHFHIYMEKEAFVLNEIYTDAEAIFAHMDNIGEDLLGKLFSLADLTELRLCGPAAEIDKLKGPMAKFNPRCLVYDSGFSK
jgi:hypothetical protein